MKNKTPNKYGIAAAVVGVLMMIFGIYRGEAEAVLAKAVRICLECIGIG
ncbi:MAG: thioredoxin [Clostridia bacterium]|nr:thioredoxin [Clostridia bacterium]